MRAELSNCVHVLLKLETYKKNSVEFPVQVGRLSLPTSFLLLLPSLEMIEKILNNSIEGEKEEIIIELLKVTTDKSEAVRNP